MTEDVWNSSLSTKQKMTNIQNISWCFDTFNHKSYHNIPYKPLFTAKWRHTIVLKNKISKAY